MYHHTYKKHMCRAMFDYLTTIVRNRSVYARVYLVDTLCTMSGFIVVVGGGGVTVILYEFIVTFE